MFKLFKVIGFIFSWLLPFGVIWVNHIVLEDASWDVDMFGLVVVLIMAIGLIKYIDKKTEVWEIQDRNKIFRLSWGNGKKIVISIALTWLLFTIEDDLSKMQTSAIGITICLVIGFVFTLIGNLKQRKKDKDKVAQY
jgi:hypothetical protein